MLKLLAIGLALAGAAAPLAFSWTTVTSKTIDLGVVLTQLQQSNPPLLVNIVSIDRSANRGLQIEAQVANGSLTKGTGNIRLGRENVSSLAVRTNALAAVNGDFFPYTGDPLGLGVSNGEIYSEPYTATGVNGRAALGILSNGKAIVGIPSMTAKLVMDGGTILPITGIDRLTSTTDPNDVVICAPIFGPTSGSRGGGTEIVLISDRDVGLAPGKSVAVTVQSVVADNAVPATVPINGFVISLPSGSALASSVAGMKMGDHGRVVIGLSDATPAPLHSPAGAWNNVQNAVGGGPILLQNGQVVVDTANEGIADDIALGPHSRTGVGITKDGKILIVTVDSGSTLSAGLSLQDFAQLLQSMGAVEAINLDGGGSTTMAVNGQTVDFPSGSAYERPVADMLAVYDSLNSVVPIPASPDDPNVTPIPPNSKPGDSIPLTIQTPTGTVQGSDPSILWGGPVGSVGFISQNGVFHVLSAGQGVITARYQGMVLKAKISMGGVAPVATPSPSPTPANTPVTDNSSDQEPQLSAPVPQVPMNRN